MALLVVAGAAPLSPVHAAGSLAPDGVEVTAGYGHDVDIFGAALSWNGAPCACAGWKPYGFDTRLAAQVAYWHGRQHPTPDGSLWDLGVTPMLRWSPRDVAGPRWFAEVGIGVHLLSKTYINNDRQFATAFQFGETFGTGVAFGDRYRYDLGIYMQHISNGRLKQPNDGITYFGAVARMALP